MEIRFSGNRPNTFYGIRESRHFVKVFLVDPVPSEILQQNRGNANCISYGDAKCRDVAENRPTISLSHGIHQWLDSRFREGQEVIQKIKRCRQVVLKGIFLDDSYVYVDVMVSETGGIEIFRKKPVWGLSKNLEFQGRNQCLQFLEDSKGS